MFMVVLIIRKNLNLIIQILIYKKNILGSQSKQYINKFIEIERLKPSNLIEIHNRPNYLPLLEKKLNKRNYTIFFHNDPLIYGWI